MMQDHISDEQWIGRIEDASAPEATAHMEGCAACRVEEQFLRAAIREWKAEILGTAERPAGFWHAQEQSIHRQLSGRGTAQKLAWAVATVTIVLATALSFKTGQPARPTVPYDPDHDLLVRVQESVRRPVPRALEPASLLAEDLSEAAKLSSQTKAR